MSETRQPAAGDVFRAEALDYHARHRGPGDVLRLAPRWLALAYWGLIVLLVAGAGAGWFVRVDGVRLVVVLLGRG